MYSLISGYLSMISDITTRQCFISTQPHQVSQKHNGLPDHPVL